MGAHNNLVIRAAMKTVLKITDSAEKAQKRLATRLLSKRELDAVLNMCERGILNWLAQKRVPQSTQR